MTITTDLNTQLSNPRRPARGTPPSKRVSTTLLLGGIGLVALSIAKRGWMSAVLGPAGGLLAYKGVTRMQAYPGRLRVSYTIAALPEEVHRFVRDTANWPKLQLPITLRGGEDNSFELLLKGKSAFRSQARITDEEQGKFIAWSSLPGGIEHRGVILFDPAPDDRGTEVSVAMEYKIPGGMLTEAAALLRGKAPEQLARETLRRWKQYIECGEIPTIAGQPTGARGLKGAALRMLYREPQPQAEEGSTQLAGD